MIDDRADEVLKKLFKSLKNRYQNNLESMKGESMNLSLIMFIYCYYKCYKINPNCGGSYTDSPDWKKTKKQQ